jgi:GNAT superfamily N-acetyltransferase
VSASSAALSIQWYEKERETDYRALYTETFGVTPAEGYFSWKYLKHPLSLNATTTASIDGKVIGALGSIPKAFTVGGSRVIGAHELDMMVKKEYRNLGTFFSLFKFRLETAREKGIALSVGMNDRVLRTFAERFLGYRDVDTIPQFIRVLDPRRYAKDKYGSGKRGMLAFLLLSVLLPLIDLRVRLGALVAGRRYRMRKRELFDDSFDRLWERMRGVLDVAVERTSAYLNWRYVENPVRRYEILAAERKDGSPAAFIVFACLPELQNCGVIVELVVAPGERGAAPLLLSRALSTMRSRGAATAVAWAFPDQRNVEALRAGGFTMEEQNLFLQVRRIEENLDWDYLCDRRRWFISMGDNDFYYGIPL